MMPSPPALLTAEASCERAIHPIGACTMGRSTPSRRVTRLSNFMLVCLVFGVSEQLERPPMRERLRAPRTYSPRSAAVIGIHAARMAGNKPPTVPRASAETRPIRMICGVTAKSKAICEKETLLRVEAV